MNQTQTRNLIGEAYQDIIESLSGHGRSERLPGYEQAVRHRSKFDSCGRTLTSPHGHEVRHWCRRPACPTCATFWGRKLGQGLATACPDSAPDDYQMATLILGLASSPDDAFDLFLSKRRALRNAVDYRRRTAGIDQPGWRGFAVAGALEVDQFLAEDFSRLGAGKRAQYLALGYQAEGSQGPQWVATAHALVHVGALGNTAVTELLQGIAPVVHLQGLCEGKPLVENAEDVVGYAAKVSLVTTLEGGEARTWPPEAIASYVAATMRCSHGRQAFKLSIRPAGMRKESIAVPAERYIEPMPVVF